MKSIDKHKQALIERLNEVEDIKVLKAIQEILDEVYGHDTSASNELSDAQKKELDQRLEQYEQGTLKFSKWEEVKARIRKHAL